MAIELFFEWKRDDLLIYSLSLDREFVSRYLVIVDLVQLNANPSHSTHGQQQLPGTLDRVCQSQGNSQWGSNTPVGLRRVLMTSHWYPQSLRKAWLLHAQETPAEWLHLPPELLFWFPIFSQGGGPSPCG